MASVYHFDVRGVELVPGDCFAHKVLAVCGFQQTLPPAQSGHAIGKAAILALGLGIRPAGPS